MARRRRPLPWLGLLLAVVIAGGGLAAGLLISRRTAEAPETPARNALPETPHLYPPTPSPKTAVPSTPGGGTRAAREGSQTVTTPLRPSAQVAVIFDDAGGSLQDLADIMAIGRPVTVAVLPGLRYSKEVALRARAGSVEVFMHLPLEADDSGRRLGPGAISTGMTDEEIAAVVSADLAAVPGASGVNNHMGSRATADARVMRSVLRVVKDHGLIFVDSMTSTRSVAASMADEMGIPTARRHVFLDNENEPEAIRTQLRSLISIARR
ncbi:MAG: divergent polysaccharide deacetylase family protein, partial [bacterium]